MAAASLLIMTLIMTYEVVMRYVFNDPTIWSNEMTGYTLVFLAFLAAPYTLHLNGHVFVDTVVLHFTRTAQLWTKLILSILSLVFMVALTYFGWEQALRSYTLGFHSSSAFGPPLFIFQIFIPIGAFLLTIQQLVIMFDVISQLAGRRTN